jgi:amylosucrase
MGDELGLRNDPAWADDPAHRDDNRWMHRPPMDWAAAERRHDAGSPEGRLWSGIRRLIAARRSTRAVHAHAATHPVWTHNPHVFGLLRVHAGERLLLIANFTADEQPVGLAVVGEHGFRLEDEAAEPDGRALVIDEGGDALVLAPYQHVWLREVT